MDKMRRGSMPTYAALLAAALATGAKAQDGTTQASDSEPASVARPCLNHPAIRRTKVLNDRNIVFVMRDDTIYSNQLPRQCPSLKRNSLVNYTIENSRVCAGDRFQVLWELGPGNYAPAFVCQLGSFVPITEAELEDLTAMTEANRTRSNSRRSRREAVTTEEVELPPAAATDSAPPEPAPTE
jgi:hypothetical protein